MVNCAALSSYLKAKVVITLTKDVVLRVILNIDVTPITSRTHTHPSYSQTSRLLTSSKKKTQETKLIKRHVGEWGLRFRL